MERRWPDLVVLLCLLQQVCPCCYCSVQREQELNRDRFSAAEAGYPLASWIQKWSFILFPLNGSSMTWAWKEWNSMLRETGLKGENSWLQGLSRSALSASLCGFVFNSDHLVGLATHLRSSGLENETAAKRLFLLPETSFTGCGKWKLRLNFRTSWKHSDAEVQSEAIQWSQFWNRALKKNLQLWLIHF